MKQLIFTLLATSVVLTQAQVAFEQGYPTSTSNGIFSVSKFNPNTTRYFIFDQTNNNITIFDQNHSVYKTVIVPTQPGTAGFNWHPIMVTENLFNTDNLVEYIVMNNANSSNPTFKIINENGILIFQEDSVFEYLGGPMMIFDPSDYNKPSVFNSPSGIKMVLRLFRNGFLMDAVYSLGGSYLGLIKNNVSETDLRVYPNPSQSFFKIEYTLPKNSKEGILEIQNENGQTVRSYRVSSLFSDLMIDSSELNAGIYFIKVTADGATSTTKLIKQ